jgi:CheY-like chemotaxis protein
MARMLVVEDDPAWRALYRMAFEHRFEVFEAIDGEDGLSLVDDVRPDVIVVDLRLPRMSGMDFVRSLTARGSMPPIVLCSGLADPAEDPALPGVRVAAKTADLRGIWRALREALPPTAMAMAGVAPPPDPWRD